MHVKRYEELDVEGRVFLNNSSLMRQIKDHYLLNQFAFNYYAEYLGEGYTNQSLFVFDQNSPILVALALCRPGELTYADMPVQLVSVGTGDKTREAIKALVMYLKKLAKGEGELTARFRWESTLVRELYPCVSKINRRPVAAVDLLISEKTRWSILRKSYRPLVNWGKQNLEIRYVDCLNPDYSRFLEFKDLHLEASGRITRPDSTWDCQFKMIRNGAGYLVTSYLQNRLVSGCFVMKDKGTASYAVAATNRELMASGLALNHFTLWSTISKAQADGCSRFILGVLDESGDGDKKLQDIELFKRGFATDIELEASFCCIFPR
jgi:hypothetical protein